jgi:hypothetical protein
LVEEDDKNKEEAETRIKVSFFSTIHCANKSKGRLEQTKGVNGFAQTHFEEHILSINAVSVSEIWQFPVIVMKLMMVTTMTVNCDSLC